VYVQDVSKLFEGKGMAFGRLRLEVGGRAKDEGRWARDEGR
jgi:hypothetical protein